MTKDQIELLRPGMQIVGFKLDFDSKPPYSLNARLIPMEVTAVTSSRVGPKIHALHDEIDEFGHPKLDETSKAVKVEGKFGAHEVYASVKSAAVACLAAIDGLDKGIKTVKSKFKEQVKFEKDTLRGDRPKTERKPKEPRDPNAPKRRGGRPRKLRPGDEGYVDPNAAVAAQADPTPVQEAPAPSVGGVLPEPGINREAEILAPSAATTVPAELVAEVTADAARAASPAPQDHGDQRELVADAHEAAPAPAHRPHGIHAMTGAGV